MDLGGYVGEMAIVVAATYCLLSTSRLQARGMGSDFLVDRSICDGAPGLFRMRDDQVQSAA